MKSQWEERIRNCPSLPALPAAAVRVLELAQQEDVGLDDLAAAISEDPALSASLLRSINSTFYSLPQRVGTVQQAVSLLGLYAVKTLILSFSLAHVVNAHRSKGFNHLTYWRRCMYSAAAARVLGARVLPRYAEECFVAALLMDLGTLVLDRVVGEEYEKVVSRVKNHGDLPTVESHTLGVTHAEAGAILARQWRLPPTLEVPMSAHHRPDAIDDQTLGKIAEVIAVAGRCADVFMNERPAEAIAVARAELRERYQIGEFDADAILVETGRKTAQLAPMFDVPLNAVAYENILERASQQLLQFSLGEREPAMSAANRRRVARMRRDGKVYVTPRSREAPGKRVEVRLRDLSTSGMGFLCARAFKCGEQFTIELPSGRGRTKTLLYTVVRSHPSEGGHEIGAALTDVLRPNVAA